MDEAVAIRLCLKHRDPIGFEYLVKKYRREAYFHAVTLLGNPEDAADACQESFTRAFAALPKLERLDRFYPWFYRILRNCCLNMLARKRTAQKHQRDIPEIWSEDSPSVALEKEDEKKRVWVILGRLTPEAREILMLKYLKGYRYDQIAEILEIPRGTVMSRLYHARKAFREAYLQEEKEDYHDGV